MKRLQKQLLRIGMQQASHQRISVILNGHDSSKSEILSSLEHLASHSYPNLQAILIPKMIGERKTKWYLKTFRDQHPQVDLRVVRSNKELDDATFVKRHARGEIVFWAKPEQRFAPRFFELLSCEFVDTTTLAVSVPIRKPALHSMYDVISAWNSIRSKALTHVGFSRQGHHVTVYRRLSFFNKATPKIIPARTSAYVLDSTCYAERKDILITTLNFLLLIVLGYAALVYLQTEWIFTVVAIIVAYIVANLLWLIGSKAYGVKNSLLLVLGLPFAFVTIFSKRT